MKKLFTKTWLLLFALIVGAGTAWADDTYVKVTSSSQITSGSQVIFVCEGNDQAMTSSSNYPGTDVTISNSTITLTSSSTVCVLTVGGSAGAYTFTYGTNTQLSWAKNGFSTNQTSDNKNLWTIATDGSFTCNVNSSVTDASTRKQVRHNTNNTNKFGCYASGTGKAVCLYVKQTSKTLSSIAVKDHFTTTKYKIGNNFSSAGLTLTATYNDASTETISSGFTFKIGESSLASGDELNSVGAKTVTITYGGKTTTETIHVGELTGIEITTEPDKTEYNEGQTFDPTGMVVTATFSDGEETPTEWTEDVTEDCTFDPDTETALDTDNDKVTVSYTWNKVEKTDDQSITVNAGVAYTVTFNAGSGSCGTASRKEASVGAGVTLPTATISVTGWSFAGWATASTSNTEVAPTLYAASSTYKPTDNITLYAVYKFIEGTENQYKRATSVSEITTAGKVVIVSNKQSKMLDNTLAGNISAPSETESKITAAAKDVFTVTGNSTDGYALKNGSLTIGVTATTDNTVLSNTTTNSLWTINTHNTSNAFYFENKAKSKLCLEHDGTNWCVYAPSTPSSNSYNCLLIYIPNFAVAYNSNPAAMVNPSVAFTTAGNKSLYVQDETSYTNAANVTGISKTPIYTSSDATVATVSAAGVVTALKAGSTTITAKVAKEVGVNSEASASYTVTVKDAKTIAGLKTMYSSSQNPAKAFTADLTNAVVTYVNGSHAYIQDASGAIYASCGSSLTAGNKINGAVSGTITAPNAIDEIASINLESATVTEDGVIPSALSKTVAQILASETSLDGQLVQVSDAAVNTSHTSGSPSGGKIKDESTASTLNLYAPQSNIEALKDAEGTFKGFISINNGTSFRLNIYEQSQITLTKNAPTDQPLAFASEAIELDEETDDYDDFTGQTVGGAQGTVTYSIDSDDDDVVTSINASTGAVVLSGNYGTATIKASAAAKEVTVAGVTTPYKATTKTYTITVYPRYTVTFHVNGQEIAVREASHGAGVAVPATPTLPLYTFRGWNTSAVVAATDTKPAGLTDLAATIYPENNSGVYHAVYAIAEVGDDVNSDLYSNSGATGTDATSGITAAGNINTTSSNGNPGNSFGLTSSTNKTATFTNINLSSVKSASLTFDYKLSKSGDNYSSLTVTQYNSSDETIGAATEITGSDQNYHSTSNISLSKNCVKITIVCSPAGSTYNTYVDNVVINVTTSSTTYAGYTTIVTSVAVGSAGYTTYVTNHDVSFPDGVTGYIVTDADDKVTLTSKASVPSGTPVVIKAAAGNYTLTKINTTPESVTGNLLQASNGTVEGDGSTIYALGVGKTGDNKGKVGFYLVGTDVTVPAGKAYLELSGSGAPEMLLLFDEAENATNVEAFQESEQAVKFFENGQLRILREGKTYDVLGHIVK